MDETNVRLPRRERMLVSIIISSHNYDRYLREAIDSALTQDYPQVEVVVVDDGSTDRSRRIIEGYGDRIVAVLKEQGGQCSCVNAGFAASRGDIVLLLDADDVLYPHAARLHAERLANGAVKSCGYMDVMDADGRPTGAWIPRRLPESGDYLAETLKAGIDSFQTSFTSGHAWTRSFLERVLPLPEDARIGPDGYLTAIDRLFGRIEFIHEPVCRYRVHATNRGPVRFRFDAAHLRTRVQRKQRRIAYAEAWIEELGYRVDPRRFRRLRDWRVTLMMHALSLLDPSEPRLPPWELVSAPFRTRPLRIGASLRASAALLLLLMLPKRLALSGARRILERTQFGRVPAAHRVPHRNGRAAPSRRYPPMAVGRRPQRESRSQPSRTAP